MYLLITSKVLFFRRRVDTEPLCLMLRDIFESTFSVDNTRFAVCSEAFSVYGCRGHEEMPGVLAHSLPSFLKSVCIQLEQSQGTDLACTYLSI